MLDCMICNYFVVVDRENNRLRFFWDLIQQNIDILGPGCLDHTYFFLIASL